MQPFYTLSSTRVGYGYYCLADALHDAEIRSRDIHNIDFNTIQKIYLHTDTRKVLLGTVYPVLSRATENSIRRNDARERRKL